VSLGAVLFDRDGTLIEDVPYNADARRVRPLPGAVAAVADLRTAGVKVGVVTNQSGIGRGLVAPGDVEAVNRRVDQVVGPFDDWQVCPHAPDDGCGCRKPAPGLILRAASSLGAAPGRVVVVGDRLADLGAARAAGAHGVLVPSAQTEAGAVGEADAVLPSLADLGGYLRGRLGLGLGAG
jgi:histidinol-phosphate phosphatase family protein